MFVCISTEHNALPTLLTVLFSSLVTFLCSSRGFVDYRMNIYIFNLQEHPHMQDDGPNFTGTQQMNLLALKELQRQNYKNSKFYCKNIYLEVWNVSAF